MSGAGIARLASARVRSAARGLVFTLACGLAVLTAPTMALAESLSSSQILQELLAFRQTGRVLYVAAHPDDENTRLIAYLARGRGYALGYLSLTRGDGGQNLVGPELREGLGLIRTQELLAARKLDGGRQFFSRAVDFGFSKDYKETFNVWNRQDVLADVVRAIRTFQPDVMITRFSTEPGETHGHHTASAILALEAFTLAADPKAFPEQLTSLAVWKVRRVMWNIFQFPGQKPVKPLPADAIHMEVGDYLPLTGLSAGEIAAQSRSMHKSQGMGAVALRGENLEHFKLLAGEPVNTDVMDGVDSTWGRFPGGAKIGADVDRAISSFDALSPEKSVPALFAIRKALRALPQAPVIAEKIAKLDRLLTACLALYVETVTPSAEVVPGEVLKLKHVVINRGKQAVRWMGVQGPGASIPTTAPVALAPNKPATRETAPVLPADTRVTQPYWLEEPGTPGMFTVADAALIGTPENAPAFPIRHTFDVGGETLEVADEPLQVVGDPVRGELRRALRVIPPVSMEFVRTLELFAPKQARAVEVELTAARAGVMGDVKLTMPVGWTVTPARQGYALASAGDTARVSFTAIAPAAPSTARVTVTATVGSAEYHRRRVDIRYDHIPPQIMQPPAMCLAVCLDLKTAGKRVGYLPGAGDGVDVSLERMGYAVTRLGDADLTPEGLHGLDAVVVGIRAFNTRGGLGSHVQGLFAYVASGGTVVVQYNTANGLVATKLAPFELTLSRDRVTDENAVVTILEPNHPVFNQPNKIGTDDFAGWVQERGLYFPGRWGKELTPLVSMHDAGEPAKTGALLVGKHGKGWFVYTGLAFFRQLPEGVPGAYRLFANLVSLHP